MEIVEDFELKKIAIASLVGLLFWGQGVGFAADVANGEKKAKLCVACHSVIDAKNKVGPSLRGIVGRAVGSAAEYKYSAQMLEFAKTAGAWDDAKLDVYLTDPKKSVPGTKMAFGGVKKPEDRADIIAYLNTLTP